MFKASIIESESYFRKRRVVMLISIALQIVVVTVFSFSNLGILPRMMFLLLMFFILYFDIRLRRKLASLVGNRRLILELGEIRIEDKQQNVLNALNPDNVDKIIVHTNFKIYQSSFKDIWSELKGNVNVNLIEYHGTESVHSIYFDMDSYYMIRQLEKILKYWTTQGINVEQFPAQTIKI